MDDEASIIVNGTELSESEARMVRLAMMTFADILENHLAFKELGNALADKYIREVARVRKLIEAPRSDTGEGPRIQ